ncbi:MAG: hypothetical protein ABI120_18645 [Gemmatimonadaceae bacterium]
MRSSRILLSLSISLALVSADARAQTKPLSYSSPALDIMTLGASARAVYRVWDAYLTSTKGKRSQSVSAKSPYWLQSEQQQLPGYSLAAYYLDDDAEARTVSIVRAGSDSLYRIVTRFYPKDGKSTADEWRNAMTVTVYAVREGREWKLSNAQSRNIAKWKRDTVGAITYVYAPSYPYNRARALRAVAFTDSLSVAFGVPKLKPITYYLAATVDDAYAIMGLESDRKYGPVGGFAQPVNRALYSGDPKWSETYWHELVHLMVAPLTANTSYFYNEGVATWLGGTVGLSYGEAIKGLGEYLREHPTVTLDTLIDNGGPQTFLYRGGALLAAMVFARGGTHAVKSLFSAGPSSADFRTAVEQIMNQPWSAVVNEWKKRALNAANNPQ